MSVERGLLDGLRVDRDVLGNIVFTPIKVRIAPDLDVRLANAPRKIGQSASIAVRPDNLQTSMSNPPNIKT